MLDENGNRVPLGRNYCTWCQFAIWLTWDRAMRMSQVWHNFYHSISDFIQLCPQVLRRWNSTSINPSQELWHERKLPSLEIHSSELAGACGALSRVPALWGLGHQELHRDEMECENVRSMSATGVEQCTDASPRCSYSSSVAHLGMHC